MTHHLGHLNDSIHRFGKIDNIVTTNSDAALLQTVLRSGLCHLGCARLEEAQMHPQIRYIPIEDTENDIYFGYIKRQRDGISPICMEMINYIKENL